MNSAFDSMIHSGSDMKTESNSQAGSNTPAHDSRNSGRSSPSVRPLHTNSLDVTIQSGTNLEQSERNGSTQCICFSQQAFHLNQLYSLSTQVENQRLDMLLQCINDTLSAVDSFLKCCQCSKESPSLLVTVATTQLVFCQIQKLLSYNGSVRLSVGEYRPSQDDELAMKSLLIERAVRKGRNTMRELRRVVSSLGLATQNHYLQKTGSDFMTSHGQAANILRMESKYLSSVTDGLENFLAALTMDLEGDRFKHA